MSNGTELEAVTDIEEARSVAQRLSRVVRRTTEGQFQLARMATWIAVPAESSAHLNASDLGNLAATFRAQGAEWIYAIALEDLQKMVPIYRVGVSVVGLDAFNRECAHFNYALCSQDVGFVVICSTDDFLVVAGPASSVRVALGRPESEAWEKFRQFAVDPRWTESMSRLLGSVLGVLRDDYPTCSDGEFVRFPR